jgi:hypothetical protein
VEEEAALVHAAGRVAVPEAGVDRDEWAGLRQPVRVVTASAPAAGIAQSTLWVSRAMAGSAQSVGRRWYVIDVVRGPHAVIGVRADWSGGSLDAICGLTGEKT